MYPGVWQCFLQTVYVHLYTVLTSFTCCRYYWLLPASSLPSDTFMTLNTIATLSTLAV